MIVHCSVDIIHTVTIYIYIYIARRIDPMKQNYRYSYFQQ